MISLYNTLSEKKEVLKPRSAKKISLFVCGITPYDFSHIGHARTYIVFDMIVKYLRAKGYNLFYLQNVTDIDDKIIKRAQQEKVFWKDLSRKFEKEYLKEMKRLSVNSVNKYARATAHIKEIISQVKRLLEKGFAYQIPSPAKQGKGRDEANPQRSEDGIYYDISKFKDYGKLSKRTVLQAEDSVSRIDQAKGKRNKGDFCLWKFSKPGEPKWPSPWGPGRPGWHIEDTAITEKYFGPHYDIHGGARDLIFPHHEAEICQMEAISGLPAQPLAKYWLHTGFLTVKGQKMSKSLRNFITIKDFLKKYSPRILRFLVLKAHYRSPIDYSEKLILQTKKELERIDEFVDKLRKIRSSKQKTQKNSLKLSLYALRFKKAMEDDFNTPQVFAVIFDLVNEGNSLIAQDKIGTKNAKKIFKLLAEFDKIFNIELTKGYSTKITESLKLKDLIEAREKYRKEKKWKLADKIRQKIKKMGYWIEDTKQGPKIKKLQLE